jgi:hypothetical protein
MSIYLACRLPGDLYSPSIPDERSPKRSGAVQGLFFAASRSDALPSATDSAETKRRAAGPREAEAAVEKNWRMIDGAFQVRDQAFSQRNISASGLSAGWIVAR